MPRYVLSPFPSGLLNPASDVFIRIVVPQAMDEADARRRASEWVTSEGRQCALSERARKENRIRPDETVWLRADLSQCAQEP
jgi:hypothetical protein